MYKRQGYMLSASQMDKRIKKVTTLSMFNTGAVRRERFQNSQVDTVLKRLHDVANIREKEIKEDHLIYNQNMSDMDAPIGHQFPLDVYKRQALGAIRAMQELNVNVPITGFDDISFASYSTPSLTTVRVNKRYLGEVAVKRLIEKFSENRCV